MKRMMVLLIVLLLLCGCANAAPVETVPVETTVPPTTEETTVPATEPQPERFTLTFAGDCTLGDTHGAYGYGGGFLDYIGDDYSYPFRNVADYFHFDDFTMVNLEGVFCDQGVPYEPDKLFIFRGPESYINILTEGSIEAVNLANNHTLDYGYGALKKTRKLLDGAGIANVAKNETALFTTESGLTIGIYGVRFNVDIGHITQEVQKLRENGAQIVVLAIHWGSEGKYRPLSHQVKQAHAIIDAGVDIIFGTHPHVLQKIETYNDGIIYYSLGNFSFGGNHYPKDMDTAVLQQEVIRETDGTVHLGELTIIPCSCSSVETRNDFQPTPYAPGTEGYDRVISKLDGSWTGPNLTVNYG